MRFGPVESNKKVILGAVVMLNTVEVVCGIDPYHSEKRALCKKMGTVPRFWPNLLVF
jgi:hypothetical protein